jgi:hypothetical protein
MQVSTDTVPVLSPSNDAAPIFQQADERSRAEI